VDPFESNGGSLATRYNVKWYSEIPPSGLFDAAIVATPTGLHADVSRNLIGDSKHVLVEKPVTDQFVSTLELLSLSESMGTVLMCGFVERFNPAFITAKSIVEYPLVIATARHSPYVPRILSGVSWDLLVHDVDLIINVFGQGIPKKVHGTLGYFHTNSSPDSEDVSEASLAFAGGQISHSSANRIGHKKIRTMSITERDRLIEIDLLRRDITIYKNVHEQSLDVGPLGYRQQTIIEIPEVANTGEPLMGQLNQFIDLIEGKKDPDIERKSVIPAHQVINELIANP
jgi:predicted dehydrogenase